MLFIYKQHNGTLGEEEKMPKVRIIKNDGNTRELLGVYYFDDITGIDNVKTKNGVNYLEVVDKSEIPMNAAEKIDDIPKFAQKDSNKHTVEAHRKKLQEKYREIKELMSKTNVSEYDFDYSEIDKATNAKKNKRLEIVVETLNTKISELNRLIKEEQKFWGDIAGNIESSEDEMTAVSRPEKIHDSTSRDDIADYSKFLNVLKSVLDKQENLSPENINKFEKIIEKKILAKFNNDPEYKRKINDIEVTTPIKGGGSKTNHEKEKESFQKYIKRLMEEGKIKVDGYTSNKFPIYNKLEYIEFLDKLNKTIDELVVEEDKEDKEDKNDKEDNNDDRKKPIDTDKKRKKKSPTITTELYNGKKAIQTYGKLFITTQAEGPDGKIIKQRTLGAIRRKDINEMPIKAAKNFDKKYAKKTGGAIRDINEDTFGQFIHPDVDNKLITRRHQLALTRPVNFLANRVGLNAISLRARQSVATRAIELTKGATLRDKDGKTTSVSLRDGLLYNVDDKPIAGIDTTGRFRGVKKNKKTNEILKKGDGSIR